MPWPTPSTRRWGTSDPPSRFTKPVEATAQRRQVPAPRRCASWPTTWPGGEVDLLLILGGNPVYTAPADIDFGKALDDFKARRRVHLGLVRRRNQPQVPMARSRDALPGNVGRPPRLRRDRLDRPAADRAALSRTTARSHELLAVLVDRLDHAAIAPATQQFLMPARRRPGDGAGQQSSAAAAVPATQQTNIEPLAGRRGLRPRPRPLAQWKQQHGGGDFEAHLGRDALIKGVLDGTAADFPPQAGRPCGRISPRPCLPRAGASPGGAGAGPNDLVPSSSAPTPASGTGLGEQRLAPGTAQAAPRFTWDNAAIVSPATAKALVRADNLSD